MNRIHSVVFGEFVQNQFGYSQWSGLARFVAYELGEPYSGQGTIATYAGDDFLRTLHALEALIAWTSDRSTKRELVELIESIIDRSELDLGVALHEGHFRKTGAPLLDDALVNLPLRWLATANHPSILEPFQKGLEHLLQSAQDSSRLADAVTDIYEALEALAMVVTGRRRDLSANREAFVSKLGVSNEYKKILREYIAYANEFRHAAEPGEAKPLLASPEVESFVYVSGAIVRLAIETEALPRNSG